MPEYPLVSSPIPDLETSKVLVQPNATTPRFTLLTDWFKKDPQELLQELEQSSKDDLIKTALVLLAQNVQLGLTHHNDQVASDADSSVAAYSALPIDPRPKYDTSHLAQTLGSTKNAISYRCRQLVTRGWLEPRDNIRWAFNEEEAQTVLRFPSGFGPLKNRPS